MKENECQKKISEDILQKDSERISTQKKEESNIKQYRYLCAVLTKDSKSEIK